MSRPRGRLSVILLALFLLYLLVSLLSEDATGLKVGQAFLGVVREMAAILPCAFILIALFEVWVRQETVMRHLGEGSGLRGYLWVLLLAGISVGGLYVGFPMARALRDKGASLKVVFVYLGFVGVFRIPMTVFEISFLGFPFTLVRWLVLGPLFLLCGILMGAFLQGQGYRFPGPEPEAERVVK